MTSTMRVTNVTPAMPDRPASPFHAAAAACLRAWRSYERARLRRQAMAELSALSDRELWDIGVIRSDIEFVVRSHLRDWP